MPYKREAREAEETKMMSHNFFRMVLLGSERNIAGLDYLLRSGRRAARWGLGQRQQPGADGLARCDREWRLEYHRHTVHSGWRRQLGKHYTYFPTPSPGNTNALHHTQTRLGRATPANSHAFGNAEWRDVRLNPMSFCLG